MRRKGAHLGPARIEPAFAGADIEFPIMPRAADHFSRAGEMILARFIALNQAAQNAARKRATLMRAAIKQREEFAAQIEHHNLLAIRFHQLPATGRDFIHRPNYMPRHYSR
jgi:hypothetical protein